MPKHKVSELEGALLDAAVAKAEGRHWVIYENQCLTMEFTSDEVPVYTGSLWLYRYSPSTEWADGGPLIERELICVSFGFNQEQFPGWSALIGPERYGDDADDCGVMGPTPLIAAMRTRVASKFGDVVELP